MKLAVIGWGSLVWNPGTLKCRGPWKSDGPALPIEFARTSRDGRLTLVLVPDARVVPTLWAELEYGSVAEARQALRAREGSRLQSIGLWPDPTENHGIGSAAIAEWALAKQFDAVVWTALPPKFAGNEGRVPTISEAVSYLQGLDTGSVALAREYVERAPTQVKTPIREALEQQLGWQCSA